MKPPHKAEGLIEKVPYNLAINEAGSSYQSQWLLIPQVEEKYDRLLCISNTDVLGRAQVI